MNAIPMFVFEERETKCPLQLNVLSMIVWCTGIGSCVIWKEKFFESQFEEISKEVIGEGDVSLNVFLEEFGSASTSLRDRKKGYPERQALWELK